MTEAVVLAAEVERIAREIVASMAVFHRLNAKDRTTLSIGGDILVERLHEAWAAFVAQQWREREPSNV
jgi:hypothetical protein